MVTTGQIVAFSATSLVLILIPGPGVLFIIGRALSHGRRTALATAVGHASGSYGVAVAVAVGLGSILQRCGQAVLIVKLAGSGY